MDQKQQKIINTFINSLKDFDAVLEKVPEGGLSWCKGEGEWTIRHVIHHVAGDCIHWAPIIEQALALPGSKVVFPPFPGNIPWGESLGFGERPIETELELMRVHRQYLAELVSCFPNRWDYNVKFLDADGKESGEISIKEMMVMLVEHLQEHTAMVENILKTHLS